MNNLTQVVVKRFDTAQCRITVYDTLFDYDGVRIYCIKSYHWNNGKATTRFGTLDQINGIIKTYQQVKKGAFVL